MDYQEHEELNDNGALKATDLDLSNETEPTPVNTPGDDEGAGWKVHHDKDQNRDVFEITDPQAYQAFHSGIEDRRQWTRHPVTNELKKFVSSNLRQAQVFVKYGETYSRIK